MCVNIPSDFETEMQFAQSFQQITTMEAPRAGPREICSSKRVLIDI